MEPAKKNLDGPDFCCVGAQKAGTGWLYEQLRFHTDFWMPPVKELHYFDREGRSGRSLSDRIEAARRTTRDPRDLTFLDKMEKVFASPEADFDGYARLFAPKGSLLSGDITPGYSTLPDEMVGRIAARFPRLKIIFLARDPVERAWSQLSMWIRHGRIAPFDADAEVEVMKHLRRPEVMARSHPSQIVARWRRHIPATQFKLLFFDDLKRDAAEVRRSAIRFLEGDPAKSSGQLPEDHNAKAKKEKLVLSDTMRGVLARFFEEELKASAEELGGAASSWPSRYGY